MKSKHRFSFSAFFESKVVQIALAILKTILVCIFPYVFIAYTIAAGTDEVWSQTVTDVLARLTMAILFSYFFHIFHTLKQNKEYLLSVNTKEPFNTKKELLKYFKEEGIPFLCVCGVLAILEWILASLFFFRHIRTYLSVMLFCVFPFQPSYLVSWSQYTLKLASPFFSLLFILPAIMFFAVRSRKKLYKKYKQ